MEPVRITVSLILQHHHEEQMHSYKCMRVTILLFNPFYEVNSGIMVPFLATVEMLYHVHVIKLDGDIR